MKQIKANSRGVISLVVMTAIAAFGAGGVYIYQHEGKINQLSKNQQEMSIQQDTDRAEYRSGLARHEKGLNYLHGKLEPVKQDKGWQAPTASWMDGLK